MMDLRRWALPVILMLSVNLTWAGPDGNLSTA